MEQMTKSEQVEAVSFDQNGNVVVNKETSMSKKLVARRAIEAHLEKKRLEQDLEAYSFESVSYTHLTLPTIYSV